MTVAAAAADPGRRSAPWPWSAVVVAVLAGAYFALGIRYTVGWESGWIDSGLVVYGSWRVADGALPYRDFDHVYGPAVFFWNGALLRAFGADLHVIRASLVVVKTLLAVGVHALATAAAGRTWAAVAATGFLVVVWGAPLWLFAEPYAQHYGVLLAVAGAAAFLAMPARPYVAALLAGLSFGCAAAFKLTCGVVGLSAVVLWILADSAPDQGSAAAPRRTSVRWLRLALVGAVVAGIVAYIGASLPSPPDARALATGALVGAPLVAYALAVGRRESSRTADPRRDVRGALAATLACAGTAVVPLAFVGFYAAHGALSDFGRDLFELPPRLHWFLPLGVPWATTCLVVALVGLAAAETGRRRGPAVFGLAAFAVAAAVATAAAHPAGMPWTSYFGARLLSRFVYDALYLGPLALVAGALPRVVRVPADAAALRRSWTFAAAGLLLLLPAADYWHALMALPAFVPLLACLLAGAARRRRPIGALVLLVLAAPSIIQLALAPGAWRTATATFARASGITHPGQKFTDAAALVRALDAEPLRQRPVVVLTGEAMLYFLAGRVSPLEHEEYVLQMLARDVGLERAAPVLADEARIVHALGDARPLVVDDARDPARVRIGRVFPGVAKLLETTYVVRERFGGYELLDRADATAGAP